MKRLVESGDVGGVRSRRHRQRHRQRRGPGHLTKEWDKTRRLSLDGAVIAIWFLITSDMNDRSRLGCVHRQHRDWMVRKECIIDY